MRTYRNTYFRNQKHFVNYCRKIVANKMTDYSFVGRKKFTSMLHQIWSRQDQKEIENFIYKIKRATPEQIEASLRRLKGEVRPVVPANHTGMYGVWSAVSKQFVLGIQKPSKRAAHRELVRKIGKDSFKYRFSYKRIKDCEAHRAMFRKDLILK